MIELFISTESLLFARFNIFSKVVTYSLLNFGEFLKNSYSRATLTIWVAISLSAAFNDKSETASLNDSNRSISGVI